LVKHEREKVEEKKRREKTDFVEKKK